MFVHKNKTKTANWLDFISRSKNFHLFNSLDFGNTNAKETQVVCMVHSCSLCKDREATCSRTTLFPVLIFAISRPNHLKLPLRLSDWDSDILDHKSSHAGFKLNLNTLPFNQALPNSFIGNFRKSFTFKYSLAMILRIIGYYYWY